MPLICQESESYLVLEVCCLLKSLKRSRKILRQKNLGTRMFRGIGRLYQPVKKKLQQL